MKQTIVALYERKSTLWKNANAAYKSTDWVKMECKFFDMSEEREWAKESGITITDKRTGEDITSKMYSDKYNVTLTNNTGKSCKSFDFVSKEEANQFFKEIFNDKILRNWKKVK